MFTATPSCPCTYSSTWCSFYYCRYCRPGFFYALLGNALYAAAFSAYHYLTFLGYSELPFLHRCECFVYPIAIVLLAFVLSLPLGINATQWVVSIYF